MIIKGKSLFITCEFFYPAYLYKLEIDTSNRFCFGNNLINFSEGYPGLSISGIILFPKGLGDGVFLTCFVLL